MSCPLFYTMNSTGPGRAVAIVYYTFLLISFAVFFYWLGYIVRKLQMRQNTPEKNWKITEEDWRNREKWEQYEVAVEEMLEKTSMPHAPWIVVEGNDKYYARIKVLECVTEAIEKRLKEERK